jgi:Zn-dependent oligopeptidase
MRQDVYDLYIEAKKNSVADGSYEKLDKESKRFLDHSIRDFKRNGMGLPLA